MSGTQQKDFIRELRRFVRTSGEGMGDEYGHADFRGCRGDEVLAGGMAEYLEGFSGMQDQYVNWFANFPELIVDMFEEFREHERWTELRRAYGAEFPGEEIPDLVNVHIGGLHRLSITHSIARWVANCSKDIHGGAWLKSDLEAVFGAQQLCIDAEWRRFVRVAYRPLMVRIKAESHRGNKGRFGKTTLMSWAGMGRVMFTFSRGRSDEDTQVTYVADDSDPIGLRSGANCSRTPYGTCVEMIREVADAWSLDKFKPDQKVSLG